MGDAHNHMGRIRSLKITFSLSVAPLYLLFKDHKGWTLETGKAPPSRPVVSAGSCQNDHLSEIILNVLEPIVKTWKGGLELESTGDMLAKINEINEKGVLIEDIDLESVDEELDEAERARKERYNNFDNNLPEGWKNLPDGWKNLPEGWKDGSNNHEQTRHVGKGGGDQEVPKAGNGQ
jgi:hypothetical protein